MRLELLLMPLLANGLPTQFEERDLAGLARSLVEQEGAPKERELFGDLLRLVTCQPLSNDPSIEETPRALVRLEAARAARVAERPDLVTIWREIVKRDSFRRELPSASARVLRWPVESERWPDEALPIPGELLAWRCDQRSAQGDELSLLTQALVEKVQALAHADARYSPVANRLAYQRAVLLMRQQRLAAAAVAAKDLDAASLDAPLGLHARLLRLEVGLDSADGYAELLREPVPPAVHALITLRRARTLAEQGDWAGVLALAGGDPGSLAEPLALLVTLAHAQLGDLSSLRTLLEQGLAPGSWRPSLDIAVGRLAEAEPDDAARSWLTSISPRGGKVLVKLGKKAHAVGNLALAQQCASQLASSRDPMQQLQGRALAGELAFAARDLVALERSLASLFPREEKAARHLRLERDRLFSTLVERWIVELGDDRTSGFARRVRPRLLELAGELGARERLAVERAFEASASSHPLQLGRVQVTVSMALPPPAEVKIDWPEPYSLLAIPASDGTLRAWLEETP